MCLIKIDLLPRITLKPKKVYKLLCRKFLINSHEYQLITPFTNRPVELGKSYDGKFSNTTFSESLFNRYITDGYIHCFKDIKSARESFVFGKLIECVIPIGTLYWRGNNGEIATRKLKYVKEV